MVEAVIALGSNIDPFDSIEKGLVALRKDFSIKEISKFYLNSAVGTSEGQHEFLNGVVLVETQLEVEDLKFKILRSIEKDFGRQDGVHKHDERRLDLDLILYGNDVINTNKLKLPHPEILTRDFVYVPLLELRPDLIHPEKLKPVKDLLDEIPRKMKAFDIR